MNAKTMEGLTGASMSISMIATPMSVAKEAERKGDTEKMQRAMGYAAGLARQADRYGEKTDEGMKLDAKEAKEQEKLRLEKLAEARKAERDQQEKDLKESVSGKQADLDQAYISEEGKQLSEAAGQTQPAAETDFPDAVYDKSGRITEAASEETASGTAKSVDVTA